MSRPRAHSPPPARCGGPRPRFSPGGVSRAPSLPPRRSGCWSSCRPHTRRRAGLRTAAGRSLVLPTHQARAPCPPASGERAASQPRPDQPPCPQAGPRADSPQDTVHTDRAPGCGQADLSLGLGTGLPSKPVPAPTAPGPLRVLGPSPSTPPWSPPRTCPPPGNPPLPLTSPEDLSVFQTQNMPH